MKASLLIWVLLIWLVGCATTNPTVEVVSAEAPAATSTPLKELSKALDLVASNPLLKAAGVDAADTIKWVNGPTGPTDPLSKARALQCPNMVQIAITDLQSEVQAVQELMTTLETTLNSAGQPEPINWLTQLKWGQADPNIKLTALRARIVNRVDAVVEACVGIFPKKQALELAGAAAKIGGVGITGGAAAPLMGLLP